MEGPAEPGAWAAGGAGLRLLTADAMVGFVVSVYALMVAGGGELVGGVGPTDVPVPIAGS